MHDVYVSGLGIISPIGNGRGPFWEALAAGSPGIRVVTRFDTGWLATHVAAEIRDPEPEGWLTAPEKKDLDAADKVVLAAGRMALAEAGLLNQGRAAVQDIDFFLGTTAGKMNDFEIQCLRFCELPEPEARLNLRQAMLFQAVSDNLAYGWLAKSARLLGLTGMQSLVINACASGGYAISMAADRIRQGKSRMALAGGADVLCQAYYTGFSSLRAMAPQFCQPFDRDRKGLVLGEAAAFILLESGASLRARGGCSRTRLAGMGWSCDGYHMSKPHPEGLGVALSIQRALTDAGLQPTDIGCYVAHGTGTPGNDATEAKAVKKIFGDAVLPVTAPKSMLGHSLGAASAVEAIVGILALEHQCIPPTITHTHTDPACPIDCVTQARAARMDACMTNSSGFGGNNATLIFTSADFESPSPGRQGATDPVSVPARDGGRGKAEPIAITGLGVLTALGHDLDRLADQLLAGEGGFTPYQAQEETNRRDEYGLAGTYKQIPAEGPGGLYAQASDANTTDFAKVKEDLVQLLGGTGWRHYLRASLMSCWTARSVLSDARMTLGEAVDHQELGLVVGNSLNPFVKAFLMALLNHEVRFINPAVFLNNSTNAPASQAAMLLETQGFVVTLPSGFTAGLEALEIGALALRSGRARAVLAGASQEEIPEIVLSFKDIYRQAGKGYGLLDGNQPAAVLAGEGCGLLQLELLSQARSRKARIRGLLLGFGMGFNPEATGQADPMAALTAIRKALTDARMQPKEIDAVFLAANGNPGQDAAEAEALTQVFGNALPPAAAVKGALGETLHAAGALAAASAILCLERGFLPPTRRLVAGNLAQHLNVSERARPVQAGRVLILAMEQDIKAAAVVIGMPDHDRSGSGKN